MKTQPADKRKIRLTVDLSALPFYLNRLLMSLSSCMGSNGVGIMFWSLSEVWF
jgi:hypothetical protein